MFSTLARRVTAGLSQVRTLSTSSRVLRADNAFVVARRSWRAHLHESRKGCIASERLKLAAKTQRRKRLEEMRVKSKAVDPRAAEEQKRRDEFRKAVAQTRREIAQLHKRDNLARHEHFLDQQNYAREKQVKELLNIRPLLITPDDTDHLSQMLTAKLIVKPHYNTIIPAKKRRKTK